MLMLSELEKKKGDQHSIGFQSSQHYTLQEVMY